MSYKTKCSSLSAHRQEKNTALYRPALEELRRLIRSSTTSMTSVPKPLKFLRPHYGKLKEIYETMAAGENKVSFCRWHRNKCKVYQLIFCARVISINVKLL